TGRYRGAFRIIRGDGGTVDVAITSVSFVGPDGSPLIGFVLRHAAPTTPTSSGEDVFLSAFDMMLELGPGGVITDVNEAASTRLGYTREELLGKVSTDFVAPESHAMVIERLRRRPRREEPHPAALPLPVKTQGGG